MELTKERLIIIIVSAIAIVILGLHLVLYRPVISKLRITGRECRAIETEVSQAREAIATLKTIETQKDLIAEEDISLAIDELTRYGRLKGINFVSIAPEQIEKSKEFQCNVCPIKIEVESTYKGLGMFLGSLSGFKKSLITVKNFNINADKNNSRKLKTKLVIDIYLRNAE